MTHCSIAVVSCWDCGTAELPLTLLVSCWIEDVILPYYLICNAIRIYKKMDIYKAYILCL